jgi:hypothetical protein
MNTQTTTDHAAALASFIGCDPSELTPTGHDHYGLQQYDHQGATFAIGTDDEASTACGEYIKDTVWAFNADFLCSVCGLPSDLAPMIRAYQEEKCERANDALLGLVERCSDLAELQDAAESADGRGHFLNPYDSTEEEHTDEGGKTFYIYRTN